MNTEFLKNYLDELTVIEVLVANDESKTFTFNGCANHATYLSRLINMELRIANGLQEEFPSGIINGGILKMMKRALFPVERLFRERRDGRLTRPGLVCRSSDDRRVPVSWRMQEKIAPYLQIQKDSLARVLESIKEENEFYNFPYRYEGEAMELVYCCVVIYTCGRVIGVCHDIDLYHFTRMVFRLLKKEEPRRLDILINRVLLSKNKCRILDKIKNLFLRKLDEIS